MHEQLEKIAHNLHDLADMIGASPYPLSAKDLTRVDSKVLSCQRSIRAIADVLDRAAAEKLDPTQTNG